MMKRFFSIGLLCFFGFGCTAKGGDMKNPVAAGELAALQAQQARLAPVEVTADISGLPAAEREALKEMVLAAEVMDRLFLRQVWSRNEAMFSELAKDNTPLGRARLK